MTRRQRWLLGVAAGALLLIGIATCAPWSPWLVYNPSDSAPHGWYAWRPLRDGRPGTPVFARLPDAAARLADRRGYLPRHLPVLKRVGAVGGQRVCSRDDAVRIDGRVVAFVRTRDGAGRRLVAWSGCRTLVAGEVFLLAPGYSASFDSRYFGPVPRDAILGEAVPLWIW